MKKLKRIFFVISISFLFVVCSVISHLQAESDFPTQSAPGLYVNQWPAFSLTYPVRWQEKMPGRRLVFRAEASEGTPSLRISVIPGMDTPLKYATSFYLPALEKMGQNIKVLYDKDAELNDGSLSREMEIEWMPYGGPKLNTLFLTVKSEDAWIAVALSDTKGSIGEDLRKIPYSLKMRPAKEILSAYHYKVPEETDDGWPTAHITDVNLDKKNSPN